jgi:hypothetical protein
MKVFTTSRWSAGRAMKKENVPGSRFGIKRKRNGNVSIGKYGMQGLNGVGMKGIKANGLTVLAQRQGSKGSMQSQI